MTPKNRLNLESLEHREAPSITSVTPFGGTLFVYTDDANTTVTLSQTSILGNPFVHVECGAKGWMGSYANITQAQVRGGAGNDKFVSTAGNLPVIMFGYGGNDTLIGGGGTDKLYGGAGRDVIKGIGGSDTVYGGDGDDLVVGDDGDDWLFGDAGHDQIIGGAGTDRLYGGAGDDTLVTIDNAMTDYADGGVGRDTLWSDKIGTSLDTYVSVEKIQAVTGFANGADRTLNANRTLNVDGITDPAGVGSIHNYEGNPLFGTSGPVPSDVSVAYETDWLLAPLAAMAVNNKHGIRQMVADFGDGTYGVRLGNNFYRVDADLRRLNNSTLPYAQLGHDGSLWVAMIEKAYAHFRNGSNTYASLRLGNPLQAMQAYSPIHSPEQQSYQTVGNGSTSTAIVENVRSRWNTQQACTLTLFATSPYGGLNLAVTGISGDTIWVLGQGFTIPWELTKADLLAVGEVWVTSGTF